MNKNYLVLALSTLGSLVAASAPQLIRTNIQIIPLDNAIAQADGTAAKQTMKALEKEIDVMKGNFYAAADKALMEQLKNLYALSEYLAGTFKEWYLQGRGDVITIVLPQNPNFDNFDYKEFYTETITIALANINVIKSALESLKAQKQTNSAYQSIRQDLYTRAQLLETAIKRLQSALSFLK